MWQCYLFILWCLVMLPYCLWSPDTARQSLLQRLLLPYSSKFMWSKSFVKYSSLTKFLQGKTARIMKISDHRNMELVHPIYHYHYPLYKITNVMVNYEVWYVIPISTLSRCSDQTSWDVIIILHIQFACIRVANALMSTSYILLM